MNNYLDSSLNDLEEMADKIERLEKALDVMYELGQHVIENGNGWSARKAETMMREAKLIAAGAIGEKTVTARIISQPKG